MPRSKYWVAVSAACLFVAPPAQAMAMSASLTTRPIPSPPTLEQLAYQRWGDRLEQACPDGSLHFTITRRPPARVVAAGLEDANGASWGDCHPWVRRDLRPMTCAYALHETGHEIGLPDMPGTGGLMDNTRMIVGSRGWIYGPHGHRHWAEQWANVPSLCANLSTAPRHGSVTPDPADR